MISTWRRLRGAQAKPITFKIEAQPDLTTCGPTCLHGVYRYFGDERTLESVIRDVPTLNAGGTLGVMLGRHALQQGYRATMYHYNLTIFDPSWFAGKGVDLSAKLQQQVQAKDDPRLREATDAYLAFLAAGGQIRMEDLTVGLLRRYLKRGVPMLTGLSATYLYRGMRERQDDMVEDDIRGMPSGHFVVLCGYNPKTRQVTIADPFVPNPLAPGQVYEVSIERVVGAILLGIVTFDANLLIVEPT
ncbi:MAG: hypothetical protein O3A51_05225 [Verrucomicrobia bacterium]|nr:hypothetical protein [Verrucomicrobiota bacterium]